MATEVVMPQMGESISEGTITRWLVKPGEKIERDQPLYEISTDKVDAEIPSPVAGVLLEVRFPEGTTVPVHTVVALIGEAGEQPAASPQPAAPAPAPAPVSPPVAAAPPAPAPVPAPAPASPAAATETFEKDLVIIGSGPGGYVAAIRAAQLGLSVAVVEKDPRYGGTCLLRGCIPTKALLRSAEILDEIRRAGDFGVETADPRLDMPKVQAFKRGVVDTNARGVESLFKKNKVEGVRGFGRLAGPHTVTVESEGARRTITARNLLLATGSVCRELRIAPTDGTRIVNSDQLLELERVPVSLIVLGAGAVGAEFASIFHSFGAQVTLVEMLPRVLPIEDEEVSKEVERQLKKRGLKVMTATQLQSVETTEAGVRCQLERDGKATTLEAEMLLVAVGRAPVTAGIGLEEELGIATDRGYVPVDGFMQTSVPSVWAIGDVVNTPWLAHVASAEGILAVERMAGLDSAPLNYDRVPSCTYCDPEVGSVGLSETRAKERGYDVGVGKFAFTALGKARILGKIGGFVKIVRDRKYDEVLGVHIVGALATELIAEACVALRLEATTEEIVRTIHAHPTLSEAVGEAAHAALGHAIHS